MRYLDIITLLEYDRNKTINRLSVAVATAAEQDQSAKGQTAEQLFDQFEQADPTTNKQYVQWIADRYSRRQYTIEQLPSITTALTKFDQNKKQFQIRDINQYKEVNDLIAAANSIEVVPSGKQQKNAERHRAYEESEIIYSGPEGVLASPQTEFASCWLGRNTDFCTARTKTDNQFSEYHKNGRLYVWMPHGEGAGAKIQIFLPSRKTSDYPIEINDSANNPIGEDVFKKKYLSIAAIYNLLKTYADRQIQLTRTPGSQNFGLEIYTDYLHEPLPKDAIQTLKKFPQYIAKYATNIAKRRIPELEERLIGYNSYTAINYAASLVGPWPELEQHILKKTTENVGPAVQYALQVLKKPWPAAEKNIIKSNNSDAITYAKEFYPDGWPQLADAILAKYTGANLNKESVIQLVTSYAIHVMDRDWPAAEKVLLADPNTNAKTLWKYINYVLQDRWPAAEKRMLSAEMQEEDPYLSTYLFYYANGILEKRWPAAEPIIRQNKNVWLKYQEHFNTDQHKFKIGQTVSVTDGPFKDFDGKIIDFNGNEATVQFIIFNRYISGKVPLEWIKEVE